ncbi:MAG: hypothetical protein IT343_06485 [Candidatus Melainabacteria bacterium]|nr:hypothetical protein [Candidatus Melainabacteria bacterium]
MNSMQMRNVLIFFSSALFLSVPAVWEYHHHNYRYARDSHTAMINEETKLKQKKSEIQHDIFDLQQRLDQKHRQLDAVSARLNHLHQAIRDMEKHI